MFGIKGVKIPHSILLSVYGLKPVVFSMYIRKPCILHNIQNATSVAAETGAGALPKVTTKPNRRAAARPVNLSDNFSKAALASGNIDRSECMSKRIFVGSISSHFDTLSAVLSSKVCPFFRYLDICCLSHPQNLAKA